jgi:D-threonate/D-erythronate kinase
MDALERRDCVLVGIGGPILSNPELGRLLTARLTDLVVGILECGRVDSIYTEGGATAASLMDRMGWKRLRVVREFAQGVVALRPVEGRVPTVAMKPGSYAWPESVRKVLESCARLD